MLLLSPVLSSPLLAGNAADVHELQFMTSMDSSILCHLRPQPLSLLASKLALSIVCVSLLSSLLAGGCHRRGVRTAGRIWFGFDKTSVMR